MRIAENLDLADFCWVMEKSVISRDCTQQKLVTFGVILEDPDALDNLLDYTFWGFMSFKYGALEVQHNLGMGVAICDLYLKNALDCNTHSQSCDQGQGWKFWEKVVMYAYH